MIIIFLILEIYLLSNFKIVINDFTKALKIITYNLLPTMFFSILFSNVLIKLNIEKYIPKFIISFFSNIFNISKYESINFIMSILCASPSNAKIFNSTSLIIISSFINPIFIIGTVGGLYLNNIKLSLIIFITNILSNIILGFFLRKKNNKNNINSYEYTNLNNIYFDSLKTTTSSLINIFSNILAFSILLSLIKNILPFNSIINAFIISLFEFSSGIFLISNLSINIFFKGLLIIISTSFLSLSIHMQMISLNEKIKYTKFFLYRIFSIFISIIIYFILYNLIMY